MSRSTPQSWYRFHIGEAFPCDSVLARWVVGVAGIANDLVQTHVRLLEGFEGQDPLSSPLRMFYFWLACAQLREAVKFMYEGELPKEVAGFISTLPAENRDQWLRVRDFCYPWEGSFVATRIKPLRDKLFHYSKPGEKQWHDVLGGVAAVESGVQVVGEELTRNIRFVFADEVRTALLAHSLGNSEDEIAHSMGQLVNCVGDVVGFAQETVITYLEHLPAGVIRSEYHQ